MELLYEHWVFLGVLAGPYLGKYILRAVNLSDRRRRCKGDPIWAPSDHWAVSFVQLGKNLC